MLNDFICKCGHDTSHHEVKCSKCSCEGFQHIKPGPIKREKD